jgi:hypothetical protein
MEKKFVYARILGQRMLEMLKRGPVTSADLYMAFEREYSFRTIKATMQSLGQVHNIRKEPLKKSSSGLTQYKYTLLPPKKIEIR